MPYSGFLTQHGSASNQVDSESSSHTCTQLIWSMTGTHTRTTAGLKNSAFPIVDLSDNRAAVSKTLRNDELLRGPPEGLATMTTRAHYLSLGSRRATCKPSTTLLQCLDDLVLSFDDRGQLVRIVVEEVSLVGVMEGLELSLKISDLGIAGRQGFQQFLLRRSGP